jgi:histidinol-phosphate phosphatase family protein
MSGKRAIFLDRDGTLNRDVPYMSKVGDLHFYPGVKKGIKALADAGFRMIIITNQSGVARGFYTERKLAQIHRRMVREIEDAGGRIDGIYYCPHHPNEGCACRKPGTRLFETAIREHGIDPKKSYMVGDRMWDVVPAHKVGCKTLLVPEKEHEEEVLRQERESLVKPDFRGHTFLDAVEWIIEDLKKTRKKEACKLQ